VLCRFWQRDHLVGSFHRSISLGSYSGLKSQVVGDFGPKLICLFRKNNPLRENFQNSVPKGFTTSLIHVLCANFVKFGWWEVGEIARCLPDQKKQNFASLSRSRFCADRAQICRDQWQTMYSECPKFCPNRFTSVAGLAERVNTVEARDKVNPVLGEAIASRRVITNISQSLPHIMAGKQLKKLRHCYLM